MKFQPSLLAEAPLIPIIYPRLLLDAAVDAGASSRQITGDLSWATRTLQDPTAYLSMRDFFKLVDQCLAHTPSAGLLGARFGHALDLSSHGLQAFSLLAPDSPAGMVRRLVQVLGARIPLMQINISQQGRNVILQLGDIWPLGRHRNFIVDAYIGSLARIATSMTRNFLVHLPPREPGLRRDYEKIFGCRVVVGQGAARMIVTAESEVTSACLDDLSERNSAASHDKLVLMIRQQVMENPGRECTLERVAERLGTTPRTLSRHMKDAGESFSSLRNEARKKFALQYLTDDSLSIAEIAERLGYSDQASFTKAFVAWTGTAPGRMRRERSLRPAVPVWQEPLRARAQV